MQRAKYISNGTITYKITGDQGPQGPKGDTGKSTYQIAVDNGFVGTESEWLASLNGDLVELTNDVKDGKIFSDYAVGNLKSLATDWLTEQYYYVSNRNVIYVQNGNSYTGFIIKVKPNTDYSCTFARFVLLMSDKTNVLDKLENVTSFNSGSAEYVAISFKITDYPIESYCINVGNELSDYDLKYDITWLYHPTLVKEKIYNGTNKLIRNDMSDGNIMELDEMHTKKNTIIMFRCDVSSLSDIEIGHGRNLYPGSSIEITSDSYTIYKYMPTKTEVISGVPGLALSDFLSVTIITNDDLKAKIIIGTSSGTKNIDNVYWDGAVGTPFALLRNGYTTNNVLEYKCNDFQKDIFAFGDSYVTLGTNERWVYYVKSLGFDNWLLDGFGGRNSSHAIVSFRNIMKIAKPRYVLWLLGMNDSDTDDSVNSSWKSCVDEVVGYCNENDIIPILATIPCVPSTIEYPVKNKRKNDYVKSIGVRYIDFAKAVGAENDGDEWYSGMRASDVHPLAKGAEALAHQAFIDMPELLN